YWGPVPVPVLAGTRSNPGRRACFACNLQCELEFATHTAIPSLTSFPCNAGAPRDGFRRPSAESAGGIRRRCVVFQDAAYDAASIERTRGDTIGRRSRAEPI